MKADTQMSPQQTYDCPPKGMRLSDSEEIMKFVADNKVKGTCLFHNRQIRYNKTAYKVYKKSLHEQLAYDIWVEDDTAASVAAAIGRTY